MKISINSNQASRSAIDNLNKTQDSKQQSLDRLSSGKRINKASEDPAGLAVALMLSNSADLYGQAARNISDASSALAIADGALATSSEITTRMSELAQQSANGTLSDDQRRSLDQEYQQLRSELDRISSTTEFNGQQLLSSESEISVQAGVNGSEQSQIRVKLTDTSSSSLSLPNSIASQAQAQQALVATKAATEEIATNRAEIGAQENRLQVAFENVNISRVEQRAAASRIMDADIAAEASKLSATNIQERAATAVSAQANIQPEIALKLLQG